jgi:hypothetical protein
MRRLRRVGPVPEIGIPVDTAEPAVEASVQRAEEVPTEVAEEAPAQVPAKPAPEVAVIPTGLTAPEIVKPRNRRPAPAKPRKRKPASKRRKARMRKEPSAIAQS